MHPYQLLKSYSCYRFSYLLLASDHASAAPPADEGDMYAASAVAAHFLIECGFSVPGATAAMSSTAAAAAAAAPPGCLLVRAILITEDRPQQHVKWCGEATTLP